MNMCIQTYYFVYILFLAYYIVGMYVILNAAAIFTSEWLNHSFSQLIYNQWLIQEWNSVLLRQRRLFEISFVS